MQRVNVGFRILIDHSARNDDRATFIRSPDSVNTETTRKTRDRAEQALESLCEMMRDVVFVDLSTRGAQS